MKRKAKGKSPGRPRKSGERLPCGRLKVPAEPKDVSPNARVVDLRRVLAGKKDAPAAALDGVSTPFDLLLYRGWISEDQHRAGMDYVRLCVRAGLTVQRAKVANLDGSGRGGGQREADPQATEKLAIIWAKAGPQVIRHLNAICRHEEFAPWIVKAVNSPPGRAQDGHLVWSLPHDDETDRQAFLTGLGVVMDCIGVRSKVEREPTGQRSFGEMNTKEVA